MAHDATRENTITREGRNVWRKCHARRAAVIIDAAAYYAAFASACAKAERTITLVGWDIDSRARLWPEEEPHELPGELGDFLVALTRRRPELCVRLLNWDYSLLFALEREMLPHIGFGAIRHPRVHYRLDDEHPLGASQHQKVVVIDDRVAFAGGIDLAGSRWDTPEHRANDPRRRNVLGTYSPFHDVQVAVDGEAARALGELVRERWWRATGERLEPCAVESDPWPEGVAPDFEDTVVGISRTSPAMPGRPEAQEVRALCLDAIRSARRTLYAENQYLTSVLVRDALIARLEEPDGPEVVLVVPKLNSGWLEQKTMTALRADLLAKLQARDRHKRLRVCCPRVPGSGQCLNVHAKVMIVDDRLLRVGSANLSNRSMAIDSECDLTIEARDARESEAIARVRHRLLSEHLGTTPERFAATEAELGSMLGAVEAHAGGERTLEPVALDAVEPDPEIVGNATLVDPVAPLEGEYVFEKLLPDEHRRRSRRRMIRAAALAAFLVAVGLAWAFTPLRAMLDPVALGHALAPLRDSPVAPLVVMGVFVLGALVGFPVTLLVVQCGWLFGPWWGVAYSLLGVMASATTTYGLGRILGRDRVRRYTGNRLAWLVERVRRRGVLSVALLRTLPVAPFGVVNVLAGAVRLKFWVFLFGTALGMTPGIAALSAFGTSLGAVLRRPGWANVALTLCALALMVTAVSLFRRWLRRRDGAASAGGAA